MNLALTTDVQKVDWPTAALIYDRCGLGHRDPVQLQQAFERSYAVSFGWHNTKLVGCARALSDGLYYAGIYDVVVLPEYQQQGVGRRMMESLHDRLPVDTITLYVVPGRELFYRKLGYHRMLTAMGRFTYVEGLRRAGYVE